MSLVDDVAGPRGAPGTRGKSKAKGYAGLSKLRKTFQRIPDITHSVLTPVIKQSAMIVERAMLYEVVFEGRHVREGDLARAIKWKMRRDKSSAIIGPGADALRWQKNPFDNMSTKAMNLSLRQKHAKMQFFKAYWLELGAEGPGQRSQPARWPFTRAWNEAQPQVSGLIRRATDGAIGKAIVRSGAGSYTSAASFGSLSGD